MAEPSWVVRDPVHHFITGAWGPKASAGAYVMASGTPWRFFRYSGATIAGPSLTTSFTTGQDVDGVIQALPEGNTYGHLALPGLHFIVEAGGSITNGTILQPDADGRAVPHTTGRATARALEALGESGLIAAVFINGR